MFRVSEQIIHVHVVACPVHGGRWSVVGYREADESADAFKKTKVGKEGSKQDFGSEQVLCT